MLRDESGNLSKNKLLIWGMIYSSSLPAEKGGIFYSILQDKNQEFIAASDKDFPVTFG